MPGLDLSHLPLAQQKAIQELNIHPQQDEQLLWIAEHAMNVELPPDWVEFEDDDGNQAYYHAKTKRLTTEHPVIFKYKQFVDKVRKFQERMGTIGRKVKPHLAVIMNEVLNRIYRELPPVTPEIIERLAVLMYIDTTIEHDTTRRLKVAIESYAEDQYDIALQAQQKADMDTFLHEVRNEQIRLEVLNKPDAVIMCTEIEGQPARVKCEQCKGFFSLEGFAATHATGKRKNHTTVKCEQTTCSVYPDQLATCEVDNTLFCDKAYEEVAQRQPHIRQKRKKVLGGLSCSEYPATVAEVPTSTAGRPSSSSIEEATACGTCPFAWTLKGSCIVLESCYPRRNAPGSSIARGWRGREGHGCPSRTISSTPTGTTSAIRSPRSRIHTSEGHRSQKTTGKFITELLP